MPQLTFIFPDLLVFLLAVPLLWASSRLMPGRLSRPRWLASLALRSLIIISLVLALSGAQLVLPLSATTTIFLIDASDSVALSQRARAETFVQQAIAAMPPDDRAGVVVFGDTALVERQPSHERVFGQVTSLPRGAATNIDEAIQLGLAMLPAEGQRRLVLLSDGGETRSSALDAARRAAGLDVPIDIVSLNSNADGLDAQITGVELPAAARAGQELRLRVDLTGNAVTPARLRVEGPGGVVLDSAITIQAGSQRYEATLPAPPPGFNRYVVRLLVNDDARPQNNNVEAFTFAAGPPKILLIEGVTGEAQQLAAALTAAQMQPTVVSAMNAPLQLAEIVAYDAVILVNVPRTALADSLQSALSAYCHDLGRGVLMVGGPQAFGAGGWRDTPVEQILPVSMDIPGRLAVPPVAIVVVIDTSGSMSAEENGRTKLSLAVEGAQRIASLLRDEDELTVVPFDEAPRDVVGPLPGSRRDEAIRQLERVVVGGGGITIHDALEDAARRIRASTLPVRHIITITDGSDTTQQEGALDIIDGLRAEGVTLTSIAIGQGADVPFLEQAARSGGGRHFLTESATTLPSILVDEAQATLRPYLVEKELTPQAGLPHPALARTGSIPLLHGLVLTTARDSARVLLSDSDGTAILAVWQFGLGRSAAWTSDMTGRWGRDLVSWSEFPRFAAQLVAWLLPDADNGALTIAADTAGDALNLEVAARDPRGAALSGLRVTTRLAGNDGAGDELAMREVAPGRYRVAITGRPPGAYLVQVLASDGNGQPVGVLTAGAVVPLGAEYQSGMGQPALLQRIAGTTGGRLEPPAADVWKAHSKSRGVTGDIGLALMWSALALLPLDIAVRRMFFSREAWRTPGAISQPAATRKRPHAQPERPKPPAKPSPSTREHELARLREAQEQARRRARGEE